MIVEITEYQLSHRCYESFLVNGAAAHYAAQAQHLPLVAPPARE
jgi:hypothetical protein